jgi:hypothetical protein
MELIQFGDVSALEEEYRQLLNMTDGKFVSSILDKDNEQGILWKYFNWDNSNGSAADMASVVMEIKTATINIAEGSISGGHGSFDNRLRRMYESQAAVFDHLEAWWPEDLLRVKYSKNPGVGKFDDLEKGSAGQKAAAIMAYLLSHGTEPLIIDQPEDDLDNALIYNLIVTQLQENKTKRQLVIVTHNPNIVVNGDSELVTILKYENGQVQIDKQGGLEEESIRNLICSIMEGGQLAFEKRYRRLVLEVENVSNYR